MDYIDRVYVDLKERAPGKFLMSGLAEPEKFIEAVKFLIDGGWITNVHWDTSYSNLFIEEKFPFDSFKKTNRSPIPAYRNHGMQDPDEQLGNIDDLPDNLDL